MISGTVLLEVPGSRGPGLSGGMIARQQRLDHSCISALVSRAQGSQWSHG